MCTRVPQAAILFDKFHIRRYLGKRSIRYERASTHGLQVQTAFKSKSPEVHIVFASGETNSEGQAVA